MYTHIYIYIYIVQFNLPSRQDSNFLYPNANRNGSSKLIKALVKASEGMSKDNLKELMCVLDIKKRFPEDLASRSLAREVLNNYRTIGYHPTPVKKRKENVKEEKFVSKNVKF